ncbi:MAG: ribonuclease HII [Candidatus Thiodiazotropha taylori]|nr:ribonuclease HII [Candidatus Thiodiazotropha taylori]MCW4223232.1 ribonuclease HII [Candidatus Thiodiazotropha endolucinida]MCG7882318.1 ribonuclease HII [Candidatus Thiodiazotropha taylori]MCG7884811.1 ribonuclease HII [Candidatus Thiodiazotropha taylori]MCG7892474.1 ribonuclease HII [Candidatus Thiodiazotropha taylori]
MSKAFALVAGVDEVGRGPLAGPVVAAAVILHPERPIEGLADSKKLSEKRREQLSQLIKEQAHSWCLGRAEVEEIDRINILQASLLAMKRAVEGLPRMPGLAMVDGKHAPRLACRVDTVIGGDAFVESISAASIIAKVARDQEMVELDRRYPGYGLARHKGYPTKQHLEGLQALGITPIHRRSFGPVKRLMT